jgi:CTD small phosphatase-like protein 2
MARKFEIIVFTASQQEYADAILDELDPEKEIFQHRLYRHHCWVLENQMHVKDIRIINRNLS